jgi:YggT family protein
MGILIMILEALWWLIIIDAVLSWVMPPDRMPRSLTTQLTDPLYAPIRAILRPERTGGFDMSPILVMFAIYVLKSILQQAAGNSY